MRDEFETNRYDNEDLWRFSVGDLVNLRQAPAQRMYERHTEGFWPEPALIVERQIKGAYVEARPIRYKTWETYRVVCAGESRWFNSEVLERSTEERKHLT